jgi:hypothetical protein
MMNYFHHHQYSEIDLKMTPLDLDLKKKMMKLRVGLDSP